MLLNVLQVVNDYQGNPIIDETNNSRTFRDLAMYVCNTFSKGEDPTPDVKSRLFQISLKLWQADSSGNADFSVEELALIKERAGRVGLPLIAGRIAEIIESVK